MTRRFFPFLVLLITVFGLLPQASIQAQGPLPEGHQPGKVTLSQPLQLQGPARAPKPAAPSPQARTPHQPGAWHQLPHPPFDYTRFDCVFVPGPADQTWANKIYCPGGRTGGATESPRVWMFDPVNLTWTDTGFDVVEDVSNYTANLVYDDGTGRGPAIYIIGGYNADGTPAGNIGTVQRFYPQTGVAEALPSADDWTVQVAGNLVAAMGTAVVNDVIYVFGGWENQAPPYFYNGTWAFDPKAPSGSRWTDLGVTINPARSYIQVAVQDDVIYAIGGIYQYAGGDLAPTTVVEALDTHNIAAGWQTKAPLPVASGEGRGFGFDADTLAPAPWGGHIYVAGGGDWPNPSAEAMEYNVLSDSWNVDFPNLNQARRDHAGVFVPLCTPDPNDGLPGLWVFGGRLTSDNPPYGDPEYYPLPCAVECNVLVVDDDWDFTSTHGGGRPYYTSTLDYLGYPYDVWDTETQGDPTAADMAPYDVVLWFTGYAWENGVFTPTNESEVAAYLDGGGNFILSSEDYYYEAGTVTPFMQNYLGIASFPGEDVTELDPVGNAGNPIGDGLGPYAMVRPDDWDAYWPTGGSEGPWDDYANAGPGADEPFRYNASGQNNSTNYDGGIFKTAFLAWPFEWIDTVEERAEILGAALDWMCGAAGLPQVVLLPPYQQGNGDAGTTVVYTLTLGNYLGYSDTFTLTYTSLWPVDGPATLGPLANNTVASFAVTVTIPADAACLDEDTAVVTALASNPMYTDTAQIRTIAGPDWQVESNANAEGTHWMAFACTDDYGISGTCFYAGGLGPGNTVTGHAQAYDIATGVWSDLPDMPIPVFGAVGGFLGGQFCVAGGFTTTAGDWGGTYALQCYDPVGGSWSTGPDIPGPPEVGGAGGAAGGVVDGVLHVTGGCGSNTCASNQHFAFDGTSWTQLAPMPDYLVFHGAAVGEGKLYVGGDYTGLDGFYEYDIPNDTWITRASLPAGAGKKSPVGAVVAGGGAFWWGGDLGGWSNVQNTTWYYDPVVNGWVQFTAFLNQMTTGAGGGLADGRLWNFGGSIGAGPLIPPPHESLEYCIPPSPGAGALLGHIYDANTGLGIANANVQLQGVSNPDFWDERRSGPDGGYAFDPLISGTYLLHVMGLDYYNQYNIGPITVTAGISTVVDVDLAASWPDLAPLSVSVTLPENVTGTFEVTLANTGTGDLHFHVSELPADGAFFPEGMPQGVDAQVYRDLAASPEGTATFIVYLKEQADLSAAFAMKDWVARGRYVVDTLRRTAERTQAGLLAELDKAGVEYKSHYIVNAVVVRGNLELLNRIAGRPEVAFIGPNTAIPAPRPVSVEPSADGQPETVEWNIQKVRADDVWAEFGVTGQGIVVSNIDTGVQYDHPALVRQYRGCQDPPTCSSFDHNYNWWDPYHQFPSAPGDVLAHGTHTMGTMVGEDASQTNQIGMAPGARWVACKGFDNTTGSGYDAELLECAEFILAPWDLTGSNANPDLRPHVVNNSWGGGPAQWWYMQAMYAWRAAGIFPGFSGGNSGPGCGTVHSPSDNPNVLSTGATDINDNIATFSSRGPADVTGIRKPDVSAPGVNIRSSVPGSGYQGGWNGTSMASPHTCGEAALLWAAQPDLIGNVQQTYWVIEQSALGLTSTQLCGDDVPGGIPNNVFGWGRIDAYEAVSLALSTNWDISWLGVDPVQGVVAPGDGVTLTLSFDTAGLEAGQCYTGTLKFEFNDPYIHEVLMPVELCVQAGPCVPVETADFSWVPVTPTVGQAVTLTATYTPPTATTPITYTWSFGDGNPGSGQVVTHTYAATGTYTVLLTVTNACGTATISHGLTVVAPPIQYYTIYLPLVFKGYTPTH